MHEKFWEAKENSVKKVLILKDEHEHWRSTLVFKSDSGCVTFCKLSKLLVSLFSHLYNEVTNTYFKVLLVDKLNKCSE